MAGGKTISYISNKKLIFATFKKSGVKNNTKKVEKTFCDNYKR
jgi:hypothetical protein